MNDLPQPPEGVLDPKIPWSRISPNSRLWLILKARLTGRPVEGYNYSSYVNITEAEADTLIANMKKDPRGYPSLDQESGTPVQWMERQEKYQKWLVEAYLENPFREQVNRKIEDAEVERRLNEIREERERNKKPTQPTEATAQEEKEEQLEEERSEKALEDKINDIIDDIESPENNKPEEEKKKEPAEEQQTAADTRTIEDSLQNIKASISTQTSLVSQINSSNADSLQSLEIIKNIFSAQTEIIKRQQELKELRETESRLETGVDLSSTAKSTSTMDTGEASGEIIKVDGDVLTIKPIEGNFKEGQKINAEGKKGLLSMLADIAGNFIGKKFGASGSKSPIKMSSGGIINSPMPMSKGGIIPPGIYDKPTRGNLLPGQAVIPLNRNVGKGIAGSNKELIKKSQPLIDTMQLPLKAIGSSIVVQAGNFIRALGPIGGFFAPYINSLIMPLSALLGVPSSIVMSLLGGPAYAASTDAERQKDIFADIWSNLMDKFGFVFGGETDDKKRRRKKRTGGGSDPDVGPIQDGPMFEKGARIAKELQRLIGIKDYQAAGIVGNLIQESALVPDKIQGGSRGVLKIDGRTGYSYPQWTDAGRQRNFANYMESKGHDWRTKGATDELATGFVAKEFKEYMSSVFKNTKNVAQASNWVLFNYEKPADQGPAEQKERATDANSVLSKMTAEKGASNSQGKPIDAFTLTGPNSGYQVPGIGEMHGKEAVIQYEKGFTVLPIENRLFSLESDPLNTIMRWKQLLGPSMDSPGNRKFAAGGKVTLYAGHADMTGDSPGGKGTNGGPDGGAPKIPQAKGYFTTEAYLNDQIAKMAASKSGGLAEYRSPVRTKLGSDPNSNWERAKKDVAKGNSPIEIHHDAESGKPGVIASSNDAISANPFFKSVNSSFGFYRTGTEGFVNRGGIILEMDALKKGIRDNPSAWISSASTKLANAIKKKGSTSPDTADESGTGGSGSTQSEEEKETPTDPFEAMESAIKGMVVNIGLMNSINSGEVTDVASYKAMEEKLTKVVEETASKTTKPVTPTQPSTPKIPGVQVIPQRGKQVIHVGSGSNRKPVGILEDNLCRAFG